MRDKKDVEKRAHKREHELERKERKRLIYYSIITLHITLLHVPIIKALSCFFHHYLNKTEITQLHRQFSSVTMAQIEVG